jgi:hypothetical protein
MGHEKGLSCHHERQKERIKENKCGKRGLESQKETEK